MATKVEERTYEDAVQWLRDHGFDLIEAPGTQGRVFLKKYNVSAAIQKDGDDGVKIFAYPGYLISGEISKLINRGYQQVLKTSKTEIAATPGHCRCGPPLRSSRHKRCICYRVDSQANHADQNPARNSKWPARPKIV